MCAVGAILSSVKIQSKRNRRKTSLGQRARSRDLTVAGWRVVPTNTDVLGPIAKDSVPNIQQVFISAPAGWRERDI
ncbi:hypothetical protein O9992_11935 [Vibrio lentus]|nr:hypothetical protein [Vibrio lentus]